MGFVFNLPLFVAGPFIILLLVGSGVGGLALFRKVQLPKLKFGHSDAHFSGAMVASMKLFHIDLNLGNAAGTGFARWRRSSRLGTQRRRASSLTYGSCMLPHISGSSP